MPKLIVTIISFIIWYGTMFHWCTGSVIQLLLSSITMICFYRQVNIAPKYYYTHNCNKTFLVIFDVENNIPQKILDYGKLSKNDTRNETASSRKASNTRLINYQAASFQNPISERKLFTLIYKINKINFSRLLGPLACKRSGTILVEREGMDKRRK